MKRIRVARVVAGCLFAALYLTGCATIPFYWDLSAVPSRIPFPRIATVSVTANPRNVPCTFTVQPLVAVKIYDVEKDRSMRVTNSVPVDFSKSEDTVALVCMVTYTDPKADFIPAPTIAGVSCVNVHLGQQWDSGEFRCLACAATGFSTSVYLRHDRLVKILVPDGRLNLIHNYPVIPFFCTSGPNIGQPISSDPQIFTGLMTKGTGTVTFVWLIPNMPGNYEVSFGKDKVSIRLSN